MSLSKIVYTPAARVEIREAVRTSSGGRRPLALGCQGCVSFPLALRRGSGYGQGRWSKEGN
jgi:hypothetical protein